MSVDFGQPGKFLSLFLRHRPDAIGLTPDGGGRAGIEGPVGKANAAGQPPQGRRHVHLSPDEATARRGGQRHGRPVVLRGDACRMHAQGFRFLLADNGVWLTDRGPPEFQAR